MTIDARDFDRAAAVLERRAFDRLAGGHVARAERQAADVVQRSVRGKARRHRKTGRLEQQIRVQVRGQGFDTTARIHAGGPVAHLIAGGTAPHSIAPVRSRAIAMVGAGSALIGFAAAVEHPGTRADPFFAKGVDAARDDVQDIADDHAEAIAAELRTRITRRA